jgi:hypothetical protein
MGISADTLNIRGYPGFGDIGHMISSSAFAQLRYSVWLLAGTALGLLLTYLQPQVLAFWGPTEPARWFGIAARIFMSAAFFHSPLL